MTGAMVDVLFLLTMTKVFDDGDETVKKYELAVRVPMERAAQEFQAKFGEVGSVKFVARAMPAAAFFNEQQKPQSPTSPAKQNHSNDTIQSPHKQQQTQETATVVEPTESGSITVHDEANEFSSRLQRQRRRNVKSVRVRRLRRAMTMTIDTPSAAIHLPVNQQPSLRCSLTM
jgi:hypothetical protein